MVLFYPMDWTFVCPTEIVEFSDRIDDFKVPIPYIETIDSNDCL